VLRKILIIVITISALIFIAYHIIDLTRNKRQQSLEIKKKFAKDSTFIKDDLTDLPLLLFQNDKLKKDYFVILFSGDGGWRDFSDTLAKIISSKGINVIGFNTIPYFDTLRSPERVAKDLERIIRNFSHAFGKQHVLIGGYSFGSEILPFVYNKLETEFKDKVTDVFMVGPSTGADFKVSPVYYYNPYDSKPVYPELLKTDKEKFTIFCDNQKRSLCKLFKRKDNLKTIPLNSGHMFTGKYREVAELIAKNIIH
jgi:type IV secretory pathway VirJ component